jgi:hypothetical protein
MDLLRVVTFSPGGRPILQKDLETGVFYQKARDSFAVTPGDKHQVVVSQNRRYGGQTIVGESHDNWSLSATWLITGSTGDNCLANLNTFLAQLETLPTGDRFIQWQPDGASWPVFFEIRGTAKWNPNYKWIEFSGAQAIVVEVSFPIAPLARGYAMDILDPFDVDSKSDYTFDAGSGADVAVDTANKVLTASGNLAVEKRLAHTARGYSYGDVECSIKATPGTTITGYKAGRYFKRLSATDYLEVYVDDNGTNSRLRIDKVTTGGGRVNLATTNLAARVVVGVPFWVRGRIDGNVVYAEHFTGPPARLGTPTTPLNYQLTTAEAALFGAAVTGNTGLSWVPQSNNATVTDYVDWPFTYLGDTATYAPGLEDWPLSGAIPGTAPALGTLNVFSADGIQIPWFACGWMPRIPAFNLCWNGDFGQDVDGWSVAAVTNINGAATSITRQTAGVVKAGNAAAEVVCPATSGTGTNFRIPRRFRRGTTYTFDVWVYSAAQVTQVIARVGNAAANDVASSAPTALSAAYQKLSVQWTPTADRTDAHVAVFINAATATTFRIDNVQVYEGTVAPTLTSQPEGKGAYPPFGCLEAEACDIGSLSGFAISSAIAGARHGQCLTLTVGPGGILGQAQWFIDPNLLAADEFSAGEVEVEVYARLIVPRPDLLTSLTAGLGFFAVPELGAPTLGFTAEFGQNGKNLLTGELDLSGSQAEGLYRMGTLRFATGGRLSRAKLDLDIAAFSSTIQTISLDELVFFPTRRRVTSPTAKDATGFPRFIYPGGFTTREIAPDLSGLAALEDGSFGTAPGLGGSPIEIPPGSINIAVRPSDIPDATNDYLGLGDDPHSLRFHLGVIPRWLLARDA